MEGDATWSLSFLIVPPLVLLAAALVFAFGVWAVRWGNREQERFAQLVGWLCVATGVSTVFFLALVLFPYSSAYHQYVVKTGTVQKVSSRVLGSSDSFQQKFVVRYTDGREFGCEDTRCSLIRPGDRLVIACIKRWDYQSTDGYDCRFIRNESSDDTTEARA